VISVQGRQLAAGDEPRESVRESEHELAFTVGGIERRRAARDEPSPDQQADVAAHGAERVVDILIHVGGQPG
jgi:hypothetical protein